MELRPYQSEAIRKVEEEWEQGHDRTLLSCATGTGKTVIMSELARRVAMRGGRTLLLAHRSELLDQAAEKIEKMTGLTCAREQASSTGVGSSDKVVIGSVQTLMRQSRLSKYEPDAFSHVFIDEAHHTAADSYMNILDRFQDAKVLGVTATPDRADKKCLAEIFDSIAYEFGIKDAIRAGWLCPIKAEMIPLNIDISGVSTRRGDYDTGQLGDAIEPYLDAIADEMSVKCRGRRTVVFLPLVQMAKDFAEMLSSRGLRACEVDGGSDDRAEVLDAFQRGDFDVICNSMLLTEGWDCPSVDCIVVLRPTRSRALYTQMVGRGTRLSEGKDHLLLLDFLWLTEQHSLCKPSSLLNASDAVASKVDGYIEGGGAWDILESEERAVGDVRSEREAAMAERFKQNRHRKATMVDPIEFIYTIGDVEIQDYEPTFRWEFAPVTEKQYSYLARNNIDASGMTKGLACKIIDALIKRQKSGKATARQVMMLERNGFSNAADWTFEQASEIMGVLAGNGWKLPASINPATYVPE